MSTELQDQKTRRMISEEKLARDIINECRVQLMLKFRFLDLALWRMELDAIRAGAAYPLATNGKRIAYDPPRVLARFQESFDESIRDYLHMIMHCIFRHPYDESHDNREAWSLTADIIVENAVMDMCATRFQSEDDLARKEALDVIRMHVSSLIPSKVYAFLSAVISAPEGQSYMGVSRSDINEWHALFERDEHAAWPALNDASASGESSDEDDDQDDDPELSEDAKESENVELAPSSEEDDQQDASQESDRALPESEDSEGSDMTSPDESEAMSGGAEEDQDAQSQDSSDDLQDESSGWIPNMNPEIDEKEWEDISKQIEMNLETFSKEWGDEAGSLMANLAIANRKKYSYTEFLRKFMVQTEEMLVNQDEFDYIYYQYGMDLYGNMPLVEPLEYKETDRIHDFVIAIDTSESVNGDLVKRFVSHTFDILKESEDYSTNVNIHIVQCDSRVQSDIQIKDLRDVDELMRSFTIRGFGGTDFRPVFDHVEGMRKMGKLTDLRGLIYFTDGLGHFPEKAPDFETAFVFMDDGIRDIPPVPPWAIKLVIDENESEF